MAVTFLNNLDLSGNQLLNARVQNLAADPGTANAGDIIYNTTSNLFKYYNGSGWVDPSAGTYTGWTLNGDSGTSANVTTGAAVVFIGGLGMTTTSNGFNLSIGLDEATATTRGGIELFSNTDQSVAANTVSTTTARTYGIQLNSSGQAVVNVPWSAGMSEWGLQGDSGSNQTITDGTTVDWAGGTGITTATTSNTLTITNTDITAISLQAASGTNSTVVHDGLIKIAAGSGITTTGNGNGQVTIAATGASTDTTYDFNATALAANQLRLNLDAAGGGTDSLVDITTSDSNVALARTNGAAVTIGLRNDIGLVGDLTVGGGDITLSGTGRIQGIDTVSASTDAASKTYVDNAVAGGLTVKGGFNASSGVTAVAGTNLYTNTALAVGDYYIVTVAGNFFGNAATPLTVGDSVLVQTAAASGSGDENDFAVIQSDTDLATISTVGIGNTNIDGAGTKDGLTLAYSSGTATVGLDITSLPGSGAVSATDPATVSFAVYNDEGGANQKMTLAQIQQGISASAVATLSAASTVVTHNLGTRDVIVQLYDTNTFDTVYADVSRTSTNTITVAFASTPSDNIRCMIYSVDIQGV